MRSPRALTLVLAVAALVAPSATATWYSYGTSEPDNALDDSTLMWTDKPPVGSQRIYFNAYAGASGGVRGIVVSPNAGLLETAQTSPVMESHMAILGVWKDCNGDGYVGLAETAAREYPSSILFDDTACPATPGPTNAWTPGAHNYNGWVSELIPIGGVSTAFVDDEYDLRVYRDPQAMIWGDPGKPDDDASVGGSCPLAPQPRGTYQSTGGTLDYASCFTGAINRWNEVWMGRRVAGIDYPGLDRNSTLIFPGGSAQNTVVDQETFGSESTQYSPLRVWDCSADPVLHSGDFYNDTAADTPAAGQLPANVQNETVYEANPALGNINRPTVPALLNETQEGIEDCDTSNDDGHDFYGNNYVFYVGETDFAPVSGANKKAAQSNFQFQDWGRGGNLLGVECVDALIDDSLCTVPHPESPLYGGPAGFAMPFGENSNWNPGAVTTNAGVPGRYALVDANEGTARISDATYFSWYAHVGKATIDRGFALPGGSGEYGSAQCGDHTAGIHHGWNCDPKVWYYNPDGSPQPEPTPLARVGQPYQFRDVDCYDGRIGSTGLGSMTAFYGDNPCAPYVS